MKAIFCHWKGNESHHKTEHSQKSIRKLEANAPIPFPFVFSLPFISPNCCRKSITSKKKRIQFFYILFVFDVI